jgi:hypothetical protein
MHHRHRLPLRRLLVIYQNLRLRDEGHEAGLDTKLRCDRFRVLVATRAPALQRVPLLEKLADLLHRLDDRNHLGSMRPDQCVIDIDEVDHRRLLEALGLLAMNARHELQRLSEKENGQSGNATDDQRQQRNRQGDESRLPSQRGTSVNVVRPLSCGN